MLTCTLHFPRVYKNKVEVEVISSTLFFYWLQLLVQHSLNVCNLLIKILASGIHTQRFDQNIGSAQ